MVVSVQVEVPSLGDLTRLAVERADVTRKRRYPDERDQDLVRANNSVPSVTHIDCSSRNFCKRGANWESLAKCTSLCLRIGLDKCDPRNQPDRDCQQATPKGPSFRAHRRPVPSNVGVHLLAEAGEARCSQSGATTG
jgi:hypothetical protein